MIWSDWLGYFFVIVGLVLGGMLVRRASLDRLRRRFAAEAAAADVAEVAATAQAQAAADSRIEQGRVAFREFALAWHENWGVAGAPQPDRVALMTAMLARNGKVTLAYLDHVGDLRAAMRVVFPNALPTYTDALAGNIVQVASALSVDELSSRIRYTQADAMRETT